MLAPPAGAVAGAGSAADAAGLAEINAHSARHHQGVLECRYGPGKGRVVQAVRGFEQGELILVESPLHIVQAERRCPAYKRLLRLCKAHPDEFDFDPLWYWCALRSLTDSQLRGAYDGGWRGVAAETQRRLLMLHREEESLESCPGRSAAILRAELCPGADATTIEALTQVWVLNCFDHSDSPPGYCTYFVSSFMSHSCLPNAFWNNDGDDHVLRARERIVAGDEVCISYLSEEWLMRSAPERRWDLYETKRFWCTCARCVGDQDLSRGFRCPCCGVGLVFAPAPGGAPAETRKPPAGELEGAKCSCCLHALEAEEATKLARWERSLQTLVKAFTGNADPDIGAHIEELVDSWFPQHWLADLAREQLIQFYANASQRAHVRVLLEQRCSFQTKAYPGLPGQLPWVLEAYADQLILPDAKAAMGAWRRQLRKAAHVLAQVQRLLRLMYGQAHRDVRKVSRKRNRVWRALSLSRQGPRVLAAQAAARAAALAAARGTTQPAARRDVSEVGAVAQDEQSAKRRRLVGKTPPPPVDPGRRPLGVAQQRGSLER